MSGNHEAEPAEHPLFLDSVPVSEDFPDSPGKLFVVSHADFLSR
jgi:hypothetical protein